MVRRVILWAHILGTSQRHVLQGIVTFNFSLRNLTQVTSTMKPGQGSMFGFFFGKANNSSRRVISKIELELNNLNSILSLSAVTPVFPSSSSICLDTTCHNSENGHICGHNSERRPLRCGVVGGGRIALMSSTHHSFRLTHSCVLKKKAPHPPPMFSITHRTSFALCGGAAKSCYHEHASSTRLM